MSTLMKFVCTTDVKYLSHTQGLTNGLSDNPVELSSTHEVSERTEPEFHEDWLPVRTSHSALQNN